MTIIGFMNHSYANKSRYFPLQIHSWKTLSFLEKNNIKPFPKRVIHVYSQRPRTIRGSINHSDVNKYRYFPLQIHSCKILNFLEKVISNPTPKGLYIFSQCPRTIRGFSNHSFASTELILDYIPEPFRQSVKVHSSQDGKRIKMLAWLLHISIITSQCAATVLQMFIQGSKNLVFWF